VGGARLRLPSKIAPYTPLVLHLSLDGPKGDDVYLRVHGECRWVDGGENGSSCTVGVEFLSLDDEELALLRQIIARRIPTA
jgi:hypothetical protein